MKKSIEYSSQRIMQIQQTRPRTKSMSRTSSISSIGKIFQQQTSSNYNRARSVSPSKQLKKSKSSQLYHQHPSFLKNGHNNDSNQSSTTIVSWSSNSTTASFQSKNNTTISSIESKSSSCSSTCLTAEEEDELAKYLKVQAV